MSCVRIEQCPLFKELRSTADTWKLVYCQDESQWQECARYVRFLQGKVVPATLLPNGRDLQGHPSGGTPSEGSPPKGSGVE